jgi:hypothetical protein
MALRVAKTPNMEGAPSNGRRVGDRLPPSLTPGRMVWARGLNLAGYAADQGVCRELLPNHEFQLWTQMFIPAGGPPSAKAQIPPRLIQRITVRGQAYDHALKRCPA